MTLAELCGTSGNYIGEIEMGRRIPSFDKIEKIASALQIAVYQLFIEESAKTDGERDMKTKDYLSELPGNVKNEVVSHILAAIRTNVLESLDPGNY